MAKSISLFKNFDYLDLEEEVNNWLSSNPDAEVLEIKYTVASDVNFNEHCILIYFGTFED